MGLPYEATFEFDVPTSENEGSRLDSVVQFLRNELSTGNVNVASEIEVEAGDYGGYAYAMVKTERSHPQWTEQLMQLEVRLCVVGDGMVQANFRSRFVSSDGVDPPQLRAGPPRLLLRAAERFGFSAEGVALGLDVPVIDAETVENLVDEWMFGVDRDLPILVCSERPDGTIPLEPESIQRDLIGLARVVRLEDEANEKFRKLTGLACFNGAGRWIWPGPRSQRGGRLPNTYLSQSVLGAGDALYNLQQTALQMILRSDFDGQYSVCRTEVIFERNRQLEAERQSAPSSEPDADTQKEVLRERRRANEFNRRLSIEQGKVAQLDQQLAEALSRIDELETELDSVNDSDIGYESARDRRDAIRELRARLSTTEKTITELNGELQRYRQEDRNWIATHGLTLPLRGAHPGWLTICNHALNIYRDPMRRYVIDGLRSEFGEDLEQRLKRSVDYTRDRTYKHDDPESSIDVGDFEDLFRANPQCFGDDSTDTNQLGYIQRFRNIISHPPVNGIDATFAQDGLRNIKEVLERTGHVEAANQVASLSQLIRLG